MEIKYRSACGQFEAVLEGKEQKDLFEQVANFQEVFESPEFYTINGEKVPHYDVVFRVREVDGNKYYEKAYNGPNPKLWGFKLPFGQAKKGGGLFPKYRLDDEDKATNEDGGGGWRRYKKQQSTQPAQNTSKGSGEDVPF